LDFGFRVWGLGFGVRVGSLGVRHLGHELLLFGMNLGLEFRVCVLRVQA